MSEVIWDCPMCGSENVAHVNMRDFDQETNIDSKCDDCNIISELTIKLKPYVSWIDAK